MPEKDQNKTMTKELTGDEVRVSASYSKKVQIKQYEPLDISCSLTEICGPKDVEKTYSRLFLTCKNFVDDRILAETVVLPGPSKAEHKVKQMLDFHGDPAVDPEDDEYPDEDKIKITT